MLKKFLLIGNGKMGSSFAAPLRREFDFTIVDPIARPEFKARHFPDFKNISERFDFIAFAVKPSVIPEVLQSLPKSALHSSTKLISLAAGVKPPLFEKHLGPKIDLTVIMTNLPVRVGKGILAICGREKLDFLEKLGICIYVKNVDEIDKYTAFVGSGSGFCYNLLEMYQKAADGLNLEGNVDKRAVILSLFEGSLALLKESGLSFEEQKKGVVTPNGTTHAGLKELVKCEEPIFQALAKAYKRAKEIGEEVNS